MARGGKRKGAGRKAGVQTKPTHLKRTQQQISLPKRIKERLKKNKPNISKYILDLILKDNPTWKL